MTNTDRPARPHAKRTRAGGPSLETITQLVAENRVQEAIRSCRQLLRRDPGNVAVLEILARAQWTAGKFEDTLQTAATLMRRHPCEPGYRLLQAMGLQALGRFGSAALVLRQCLCEAHVATVIERAQEMLIDLESLQNQAICSLQHDDPVFALEFESDPEQACRFRGFEMCWFEEPASPAPECPRAQPTASFSLGRA